MIRLLRSFGSEPRPSLISEEQSEWKLFAGLVGGVSLEVALRGDVSFTSSSVLLALALMPLVFWRRSNPLLATGIAFGSVGILEGLGLLLERDVPDLNALAFLLILPYSLFRWGSGREALLGLPIVLGSAALGLAADALTVGEILGGFAILLAPVALGIAGRYREAARRRELEEARSGERLSLARELHDTVAHHVSAIAVRAQAGIATSAQDPEAAVAALQLIGEEASRTLAEMRAMVRVLRDAQAAELAPGPRVEDLAGLAHGGGSGVQVVVNLSGELTKLSPAVSGSVYRLAQESVTNANRHARGALCIHVEVVVEESFVRLRVQDDGELAVASSRGYGLIGMKERAQLLGGTLEAGPGHEGGWTVTAVLPHRGAEPTT